MIETMLLSEMRILCVNVCTDEITDEQIQIAVTANEELKALGYTLRPQDLLLLARCEELRDFPARMRKLLGSVDAEPMYPGFPEEVLNMDIAVFRFHQLLHYFSTYGLRQLTGQPVKKGWLPHEGHAPARNIRDDRLLELRTLELTERKDAAAAVLSHILSKTERMTDKERAILRILLPELKPEAMPELTVRFKENLIPLFLAVADTRDADSPEHLSNETRLAILQALCQHTGDVLKCARILLQTRHYHLRTAEKRMVVRLLERYPALDFRENLMRSNQHREEVLQILQRLDYNHYSRSGVHRQAVAALRAGELCSWEGGAKRRIAEHAPDTLSYIASRPGMMLRMLTLLLRNGFEAGEIADALCENADALRTQTLVTLLNRFACPIPHDPKSPEAAATVMARERAVLTQICMRVLEENLKQKVTPLRGKKVALHSGDILPECSQILTNDKSNEGGYIASGMAYRIPEGVNRIRFFVYWDDEDFTDVDLHARGTRRDGTVFHVGWNSDPHAYGVVHSGDITHSDAAEYTDIDLTNKDLAFVTETIHLYFSEDKQYLGDLDTCFVGCMAVNKIGEEVALYDPKNCFFSHQLTMKAETLQYGYVDAEHRCVCFVGEQVKGRNWYSDASDTSAALRRTASFTAQTYLDMLCRAQGAQIVPEEEAEIVLVFGKAQTGRELSLIDNNYFMDAKNA